VFSFCSLFQYLSKRNSSNVTQNFGGVPTGSDSSLAPGHISIGAAVGASFALE
jgi:hypothetical protein